MLWGLVGLPIFGGALALLPFRSDLWRRALLIIVALLHSSLLIFMAQTPLAPSTNWIALDSLSLLFLALTDGIFLAATLYTFSYLRESRRHFHDLFSQERTFITLMLFFLAMMSLAILSQHSIISWVAIEATTLITAALICFHRSARALEAAWKYMLICSVGIALALAGAMSLAVAAAFANPDLPDLTYQNLNALAPLMNPLWLKIAFVLLFIGYGTKIGFFPMHTWLPDAHSESPTPVSALLSAALLNCAFVALLRILAVANRSLIGDFSTDLLRAFALLSIVFAVVFINRQTDYKRLLAYSSIEHFGIAALGCSYIFAREAALLHAVNHSLVKAWLFFTAGNILTIYHSKNIASVRNLATKSPVTAALWILGLFAICGFPPFGIFISEFWLITQLIANDYIIIAAVLLVMFVLALVGMSRAFIGMTIGDRHADPLPTVATSNISKTNSDSLIHWQRLVPIYFLIAVSVWCGISPPASLRELLAAAAKVITGE